MTDSSTVLEFNDIHKTFKIDFYKKKVEAVRGVSFGVQKGEIFGLLGPNGAGKTTLIKTAMGLIFPSKGTVSIMGKPGRKTHSRKSVGYLPENPYFHEYLSPRELLDFYGVLSGLTQKEIHSRRDELIERVGLGEAAGRPLRKFSKGMLQRVGLAQAMMAKPKLLVLDEPLSGLDPIGRKFFSDLIKTLHDDGATIIFSSHILSDVERLCHRVVILNKGRIVSEGRLDALLTSDSGTESLESLFMRKAIS